MNFKCRKCKSSFTYVTKYYKKCRKCGFIEDRNEEEIKEEEELKDSRY